MEGAINSWVIIVTGTRSTCEEGIIVLLHPWLVFNSILMGVTLNWIPHAINFILWMIQEQLGMLGIVPVVLGGRAGPFIKLLASSSVVMVEELTMLFA